MGKDKEKSRTVFKDSYPGTRGSERRVPLQLEPLRDRCAPSRVCSEPSSLTCRPRPFICMDPPASEPNMLLICLSSACRRLPNLNNQCALAKTSRFRNVVPTFCI